MWSPFPSTLSLLPLENETNCRPSQTFSWHQLPPAPRHTICSDVTFPPTFFFPFPPPFLSYFFFNNLTKTKETPPKAHDFLTPFHATYLFRCVVMFACIPMLDSPSSLLQCPPLLEVKNPPVPPWILMSGLTFACIWWLLSFFLSPDGSLCFPRCQRPWI